MPWRRDQRHERCAACSSCADIAINEAKDTGRWCVMVRRWAPEGKSSPLHRTRRLGTSEHVAVVTWYRPGWTPGEVDT